ncbi:GAF domain-containing protein [Kineococcus sp. GCM10028916]|uniref:GAF domain-containing protein n=1 Tax=Kineococcus sp. GCM10028916 TaxID=3273394 RepID=UPI003633AB9D
MSPTWDGVPAGPLPSSPAPSPQEAARASLRELAAEAAGVGTYVLHLPHRELVADDRVLELSGLDRESFTGRPEDIYAHMHPEDVADVIAQVEHTLSTGEPYSCEYRVITPSGRTRWTAARGRVVTDESGTTTALLGALYDVSAIRADFALSTQILETMSAAFYSLDHDWRFTYVNAPAEALIGRTRQETVGQVVWDLFPAARDSDIEATYRAAATSGEPTTLEAYYPEPLNAWYEIRAWPSAEGLSVFFLDITARRSAQDAVDHSTRTLVAISEIATALANAQDVTDLVTVMAERGLVALGADGGSVAVPDPVDPTHLLSYITANFGESARADFARLPLDAALPVTVAASTGERVLLADQGACEAFSAHLVAANLAAGCQAWASMPLRAGNQVIGVLTAGWKQAQVFPAEQLDLLDTYAAQCAQALQRMNAREAERVSAAQQAALVAVARALGEADDEDGVLTVFAAHSSSLLHADGSALCLREAGGTHVQVVTTDAYTSEVRSRLQRLPVDFPLPAVHTAVSGIPFFHHDRAQSLALFPGAQELYTAGEVEASAAVPLRTHAQLLGCLSVSFTRPRRWPPADRDLLEAFATLIAQALGRVQAHEAERAASAQVARFSETLQRSMLTEPPQPDHLQLAVRYSPAAAQAEVGGD